ncbi:MAG: D-alanyl-D-alanine carboxypeptidase family protein [Clostridia bacterium]|nr:D-alanyl-D-alanine carboxypeptidase family protein [Clostridia bacterium]
MRVLLAALGVAAVVAVCVALTSLMPKPDPELLSGAQGSSSGESEPAGEPMPSPEPTITPTPPLYAPFGAQYGFGGAELIPETPTPEPTVLPSTASASTPEPTSAPASESYTTLKKGSKGAQVTRLQQALIELGYLSGAADGDFGQNTQDAVVLFQAVNGLSADGIAGTQTQRTLFSGQALSADEAPEMDYLLLVNRDNKLDQNYVPTDLVAIADIIPSSVLKVKYEGTRANRTATEALLRMLEDAIADGVDNWQVSSAYRGYSEQQSLVDQSVSKYQKNNPSWSRERCLSATYQTVAPAGTSEHMTGLAFDITVPGVSFTGTEQQKWLHEHCYEYGFIVRFTKDKEKITGFLAESWHFRYVGTEAAQIMTYNNWCLEEYVEKMGA